MSWDIDLTDAKTGKVLHSDKHHEAMGGTYEVTDHRTELSLNVTFNYSDILHRVLPEGKGMMWLDGKTGEESLSGLAHAIAALDLDDDVDYWKATEGNVSRALVWLFMFAEWKPEGVWVVRG